MKAKKKQKSLIVVVMLMLLVSVIAMSSATFAKYITNAPDTNATATVAKWGFAFSANAEKLFGQAYYGNQKNLAVIADDGTVNVKADGNVVAPGTTGSMTFSITGQAEVRAQLTVNISGEDIFLKKGEETYNPIKWTLKKGNGQVEAGSLADIIAYFGGDKEIIEPGKPSALAGDYELSWTWAFDNETSGIAGLTADEADTILGQAANDKNTIPEGYTANTALEFKLEMSVEQIQAANS